jgi:capsular polysaccharide biosynthesis protein
MNQPLPRQTGSQEIDLQEEISLIDILLFLKGAWKVILMMGLAGLVISGIYLLITPNQYEAVANIAMARVPADKNPLGVNIEEPQALINRMSVPSSFDAAILNACGLQDVATLAAQMSKVIKLSIPKGVANVIELKVTHSSPEIASACAKSVYESIAHSQAQMIGPMAKTSKANNSARLAKVEERLAQDKVLLAKAEQPRGVLSPLYFSILTEIRALEDERVTLLALVEAKHLQAANLQSPIYVADKPVYPKKMMSLVIGLMGGLLLGLLIALGRQMYAKLKSEAGGAL